LSFVAYFLKFARFTVFRPSSLCKFRRLDELNDLLLLLPILPQFVFNAFILSQNLNHKIRRELHFDDMWLIGIVSLAGSLGGLLADEFLIKEIWDGILMGYRYFRARECWEMALVECEFVSIES
jgi:hypothetical protein